MRLTTGSIWMFDERIGHDEADTGHDITERGVKDQSVDGLMESIAEKECGNDEQTPYD